MFGIKVPRADEAMLISGGRGGDDGTPFKVVIGSKAFIPPFVRNVSFLTLAMQEAEINEPCTTTQGINVGVRAVVAFKVNNDTPSIVQAGQRFLSDQNQMPVLTGRIFAGHLRSIVGSMTLEDIIKERQKLATEVLAGSEAEMATLGLKVDSFQISSITDGDSGYIQAMSAPHIAQIQQQAQVAQAEADRAAAEAKQKSVQAQAQYARETAEIESQQTALQSAAQAQAESDAQVAQATAQATSQKAQATSQSEAEQARAAAKAKSDVAQAEATAQAVEAQQQSEQRQVKAKQATVDAQSKLAEQEAELRQQQLVSEVIKPAQADAERVQIAARAQADATTLQAQAAASNNRVELDRLMIEQIPDIVKNAAEALKGANLTVLNGSEGLADLVTGLMSQGQAIFNVVKGTAEAMQPRDHKASNGHEIEIGAGGSR